jgi:uncharacterized hydrophobic protein (TIGR00271 family)
LINRDSFHVTPERSRIVRQEIANGSEPEIRFYLMVVVSTMIACFGLVMSSTAVIIGAMLVAPLMTPIFGMALALIRSDAYLLGRAARAEIAGVVAAIMMGFLVGMIYPGLEPTPEMLARTHPQLFDLLVAVFSGFAGAYAMVDERISPALPGVAIATAIVPPLANTGLCFSVGAYAGGVGSFLLFFSNFLSILLVASAVFWFFGMTEKYHGLSGQIIIKRFGLPFLGFLLIGLVLTNTLYQISKDRRLRSTIENVLIRELADLPSTSFDKMIYQAENNKIHIFANVYSAMIISPTQVSKIQKRLAEELEKTANLTIRSTIAQTVAALNTYSQVTEMNLDGRFIKQEPHPRVLKTKIADSTIRSFLENEIGAELQLVRLLQMDDEIVVIAEINGYFEPSVEMMQEIESLLRDKLEEPGLLLVVRFQKPDLYDRDGFLRFELTGFLDLTSEQKALADQIEVILRKWFESEEELFISGIDYTLLNDSFYFFLETTGTQIFSVQSVHDLEHLIMEKTRQQVNLHVLSKIEAVVTTDGYESSEIFTRRIQKKLAPKFKKDMEKILENYNL